MKFLIEMYGELDIEAIFLREKLDRYKFIHSYDSTRIAKICKDDTCPVGTIPFVERCLQLHENPIEIPVYLRTDEFLKRDYRFMKWNEVPRTGRFFLKDASNLKKFGKIVNADYEISDELWNYKPKNRFDSTLVLSKQSDYIVSSLFPVKSEYRVYVFGGSIEQIICYDGDCTLFPDMNLIKKTVTLINTNEKWLKSYTIDVMVNNRETALIEIHNFTSCGLYGTLWNDYLIQAYIDGINYLKYDNRKLYTGKGDIPLKLNADGSIMMTNTSSEQQEE